METSLASYSVHQLFDPDGVASVFATDLQQEERERLISSSQLREYAASSPIFREGEEPHSLALLIAGEAKLTKISHQGRECVLCLVKEGRMIDPAALYYVNGYPASATAVRRCVVLHLPCERIRQALVVSPALASFFVKTLSLRQRLFINKTAESQGLISVSRRVASWILHRSKMEQSLSIEVLGTRELLARLLGISRESLSRELNTLARAGVILLERHRITICNEQALREVAFDE